MQSTGNPAVASSNEVTVEDVDVGVKDGTHGEEEKKKERTEVKLTGDLSNVPHMIISGGTDDLMKVLFYYRLQELSKETVRRFSKGEGLASL